jgi:type IX secretion system PorP/SprF family membrane protein
MKKILLSLALAFVTMGSVVAQEQHIVYDLYLFNYYLINPAVAGAERCGHFMVTDRHKWIGMEGPNTQTFSYRSRPWENIGVGGYLFRDQNGNHNYLGGQLSVAYHIPMSPSNRYRVATDLGRQLSFGLSVKFNHTSFDTSNFGDQNDIALQNDAGYYPNANVGVYYTSYGFFAGLSATNLIPTNLDMYGDREPDTPLTGMFFLGNAFKLGSTTSFEPSIMVMANEQYGAIGDLNLKFTQNLTNDFSYYISASYRGTMDFTDNGRPENISAYQPIHIKPMVGFRFGNWNLAYGCGIDLNKLNQMNYGTHELMLGYTLCIPAQFCR